MKILDFSRIVFKFQIGKLPVLVISNAGPEPFTNNLIRYKKFKLILSVTCRIIVRDKGEKLVDLNMVLILSQKLEFQNG